MSFCGIASLTNADATEDTEARMAGIGVVLNPRSRRNARDPNAAEKLARRAGADGLVRCARSLDELAAIAREFRERDIGILAIAGGDGTNTVTLSGFLEAYGGEPLPPVALLRGGTMNTVANAVGVLHRTSEDLLGDAADAYAKRGQIPLSVAERNVLCVAPGDGSPKHYGFLFGTGVMHGFLAEYYRAGEPTPWVAARTLARGVGSALVGGAMIRRMAQPFHGSASLDDGTQWPRQNYLAVAAGTVTHIGLSFRPFYRCEERPGAFHALGIHATPAQFVVELPRVHRGQPMRPGRTYDVTTSRMDVSCAEGPLKYMIDGDLHEVEPHRTDSAHKAPRPADRNHTDADRGGRVTVSMGPRLRLLVPRGRLVGAC